MLIALVARVELRGSPNRVIAMPAFHAYLTYVALVLLPGSLYLYLFHGDWYLLYLLDTARIPSALVVLGVLAHAGIGALGFLLAAACIRRQREPWAGAAAGIAVSVAVAALSFTHERLAVVGTYVQFRGDFGLRPFGGELLQGVVCITFCALLGLGVTAYQLGWTRRRS